MGLLPRGSQGEPGTRGEQEEGICLHLLKQLPYAAWLRVSMPIPGAGMRVWAGVVQGRLVAGPAPYHPFRQQAKAGGFWLGRLGLKSLLPALGGPRSEGSGGAPGCSWGPSTGPSPSPTYPRMLPCFGPQVPPGHENLGPGPARSCWGRCLRGSSPPGEGATPLPHRPPSQTRIVIRPRGGPALR